MLSQSSSVPPCAAAAGVGGIARASLASRTGVVLRSCHFKTAGNDWLTVAWMPAGCAQVEPHLQPCFSSFAYAASFLQHVVKGRWLQMPLACLSSTGDHQQPNQDR